MTNQIEAIAEKCRAENWERADLDYVQFAKMIIEECANFIDSHEQVDHFGEAKDIVYGDDVLKHFGFE